MNFDKLSVKNESVLADEAFDLFQIVGVELRFNQLFSLFGFLGHAVEIIHMGGLHADMLLLCNIKMLQEVVHLAV